MDEEKTGTYTFGELSQLLDKLGVDSLSVSEEPTDDLVDGDLVRDLAGRGSWEEGDTVPQRGGAEPTTSPTMKHVEVTRKYGDSAPMFSMERLIERLRREADVAPQPLAAILLHDLGQVYEFRLSQPEQALHWYQESYRQDPRLGINVRCLKRLLARRGDNAGALQLIRTELTNASSPTQRVALLVERARIELDHLSDPEAARADLMEAHRLDPADSVVADLLEELFLSTGTTEEVESLWRRRLEGWSDPELRSAVLCDLAQHCKDAGKATAILRQALELLPTNSYALRGLLKMAREAGDHAEVARLLECLAQAEQGPLAVASLADAARIHAHCLSDHEAAIRCLEQACELAPTDFALHRELAELLHRAERWPQLAAVLETAMLISGDKAERAVVAHNLARVRAERLDEPDGAIVALQQAVGFCPDHVCSRRMLGRLCQQEQRYGELVQLLSQELELFADPERRGMTHYRIGSLHEQLEEPARAVHCYQQALVLLPGFRPAVRGLDRVFSTVGRLEDLVAVYERSIAALTDPEEKIRTLGRIAEIWEDQLEDSVAALSAHERLLAIDPSNHHAIQALRRLYTRFGRWQELVSALRSEAEQSPNRRWSTALRDEVGTIQEHQLGDQQAALSTYLELLERSPGYAPAAEAARRLLERAGDWPQQLLLYRRELAHCEDPRQRVLLLQKTARLLEEKLDSPVEAAAAYVEALVQSNDLPLGADELIRLHRDAEGSGDLLQLLLRVPAPVEPRIQALHHRRVAEVMLQCKQALPVIDERLRRSLAADPDDDASLQLAIRLHGSAGDKQRLATLYQQALQRKDAAGEDEVLHKLAWVQSQGGHGLDRAASALEQISARCPQNCVPLQQLRSLLCRLERWGALAEVTGRLRTLCKQPEYQTGAALELAALFEERLGDLEGAVSMAREVLRGDPRDLEALSILERNARAKGDAQGLAVVLGRYCSMSQTIPEGAAWLTALGALQVNSGDVAQGISILRSAAELEPGYLPAARALFRAAERGDEQQVLAWAKEREAALTTDSLRKAVCRFEAGRIWQADIGDEERAIAAYRQALEACPSHRPAFEVLQMLYAQRGQDHQIVELLEQVATTAPDPDRQLEILVRQARVQLGRLGDRTAARETLDRALALETDDRESLVTLAGLFQQANDPEAVARVDRRLTPRAVPTDAWADTAGVDGPLELDTQVLDLDPQDPASLERLSEVLVTQKNWIEAARAVEQLLGDAPDGERGVEQLLRLAEIRADGLNDMAGAVEACRRALALQPQRATISERLSELLLRMDNQGAPETRAAGPRSQRSTLDDDPFDLEAYNDLCRTYDQQGRHHRSYIVRELLLAIGGASDDDRKFVEEWGPKVRLVGKHSLTGDELDLLLPPEEQLTRRIMTKLESALREALAPVEGTRPGARRFTGRSHPDLTKMLQRIARLLGQPPHMGMMVAGGIEELTVDDTAPPTLYVGREMGSPETGELEFRLARLLAHVRLQHFLPARLGVGGLGQVLAAVAGAEAPPGSGEIYPLVHRVLEQGQQSITLGGDPLLEWLTPERWLEVMAQSEDRLALVVCGNIKTAVHTVVSDEGGHPVRSRQTPEDLRDVSGPRLQQLLRFAVGEHYLTLMDRLSAGAQS